MSLRSSGLRLLTPRYQSDCQNQSETWCPFLIYFPALDGAAGGAPDGAASSPHERSDMREPQELKKPRMSLRSSGLRLLTPRDQSDCQNQSETWRPFLTYFPARLTARLVVHLTAQLAMQVASKFSQPEYRGSPWRTPGRPLKFCLSADTPPDSEHCSLEVPRQDSEFAQTPAR